HRHSGVPVDGQSRLQRRRSIPRLPGGRRSRRHVRYSTLDLGRGGSRPDGRPMSEVVVVGGGMAGISVAYELAETHRVTVVEAERQLAFHSTGRSAAMFFQNYGSGPIRPLSIASDPFFVDPPPGLADAPLTSPRGALWIARYDQAHLLPEIAAAGEATGATVIELTPEEVAATVPVIRTEYLAGGLLEPDPYELDVAAIHQAFLRGFRARG